MSQNTAIYDLGEIHASKGVLRKGGTAASVARPSVLPALAASASLFAPGTGHLLLRELQAALFFTSTLGCAAGLGWVLWQRLPELLPLLALLEVPFWSVAVAFAVLFAAIAALHVVGVLDAQAARWHACLPRTAHPILAALASAVVPGWGQLLAGKRVRGALFLSLLWIVGAAWLVALPVSRQTLDQLGLPLPLDERLVDQLGPIVLMLVTGVIWALAVWDAAASRLMKR